MHEEMDMPATLRGDFGQCLINILAHLLRVPFRQQSTRTDSLWVTGFPSVVCDRGPDLRRFWTRIPQRLEAMTCSMSRRRQRLQRRHLQISYQLLRGDLVCERGVTACELDGVDGVLGRMVASTS